VIIGGAAASGSNKFSPISISISVSSVALQ
jgi:hypothetical protein